MRHETMTPRQIRERRQALEGNLCRPRRRQVVDESAPSRTAQQAEERRRARSGGASVLLGYSSNEGTHGCRLVAFEATHTLLT